MSGLAGVVRRDDAPAAAAIAAMTSAMAWRARSPAQHHTAGPVAFGFCAMPATAEDRGASQPLVCGDMVFVFDGRIDNREELRALLGCRDQPVADLELLQLAWLAWGDGCVERIDGDFALAVWDGGERRLFCARDRFGNRPLHYFAAPGAFLFATDAKALLDAGAPRQMDEAYLAEQFAHRWVSRDRTCWTHIKRLEAAHCIAVQDGRITLRRYWEPRVDDRVARLRDADAIAEYRELLVDAVRRASRTDGPLACETSGGLDSSALTAIAAWLAARGELPASGLFAVTMDFRGEPEADESTYAQLAARHAGLETHWVAPAEPPVSRYVDESRAHGALWAFPNSAMLGSLYASARSRGAHAVLSGTGGDEWLSWVEFPVANALRRHDWKAVIAEVRAGAAAEGWGAGAECLLRQGLLQVAPGWLSAPVRRAWRMVHRPFEPMWMSRALSQKLPALPTNATERARGAAVVLERRRDVLEHALTTTIHEMMERLAASAGVERRTPFWTRPVVEFCWSLPERFRYRDGTDKWLHRQAMREFLPPAILQRADKAVFNHTFTRQRPQIMALARRAAQGAPDWVDLERFDKVLGRGLHRESTRDDLSLWALVMAAGLRAP